MKAESSTMNIKNEPINFEHIPVMRERVLELLDIHDGGFYVDATFGRGGHTVAMLEQADCTVLAIDRDIEAFEYGQEKLKPRFNERLILKNGTFDQLPEFLNEESIASVDGVLFDLGVSSPQLDDPKRGFSFQKEGPLDMRMSSEGMTAAEVLNTYSEKDIADILFSCGQERASRSIARAVVEVRKTRPFETTRDFASLVHKILGYNPKRDTATRSFMALRIYINRELDLLKQALDVVNAVLKKGGRLVVISFHSLEDTIVKQFLHKMAGVPYNTNRYQPPTPQEGTVFFTKISKRVASPTSVEIAENVRARSAKLRWAQC